MDPHLPASGAPLRPEAAPARRRAPGPFRPRVPETLRTLYEQYCAHEARELVALLSREGRRALLRQELARGRSGAEPGARGDTPGDAGPGDSTPSVDALFRAARRVLPLPPYDRWVPLYLENRGAYLDRLEVPTVPARDLPVTVALRPLPEGWWAHLTLRKVPEGWRGGIAFHREPAPGGGAAPESPLCTAEIFRGPDAEELRQRFLDFAPAALDGFLRSTLP